MERYLTRRARPVWFVRAAEVILLVVLAFWTLVTLSVMFRQIWPLSAGDLIAALLLCVLPAAGVGMIILRRVMRSWAVKIASVLEMAEDGTVSWAQIRQHTRIHDPEKVVWRLYRRKYLRNIRIQLGAVEVLQKPEKGRTKCAMCGAALQVNRLGKLQCPYCGTRS